MTSSDTIYKIREILARRFHPIFLEVKDDSARHAGHTGARKGGGHFQVEIVSAVFKGLSLIEQHRKVNDSLRHLLREEIHALQLNTSAPSSQKKT